MSIYEYDEEGHMKVVREEGFQEGQASVLLPMIIKKSKRVLTVRPKSGIIVKLSLESRRAFLSQPRGSGLVGKKKFEKKFKNVLDKAYAV